jgi:hypothetical protein
MEGKKGEEISEVGENLVSGSGWIGSIRRSRKAVPIRPTVPLGTKAEKAFRIQAVSISIKIFHPSPITQHPALPIYCKNVAVLEEVCRISYVVCRGKESGKKWTNRDVWPPE